MMRLFGKPKQAPSPADAIQRLRETLELLEKREKYLEKKIENELALAKKNAKQNKRVAIMALKRKKIYESQIEKLSSARMTIDTQILAIENATTNYAALDAMKTGANALKSISQRMTIDDVEDTMEEIREQMDLAQEIGDAIAQPIDNTVDEEELTKELEDLEKEDLDAQLSQLKANTRMLLPSVLNNTRKIKKRTSRFIVYCILKNHLKSQRSKWPHQRQPLQQRTTTNNQPKSHSRKNNKMKKRNSNYLKTKWPLIKAPKCFCCLSQFHISGDSKVLFLFLLL
jgi:charged multivesicular body protein 4